MKQYKARDKITQKMTRDGAIEVNAATGKQKRISKRAREAALLKTPEQQAAQDAQAAQPLPGNPAPDISPNAPPLPHAPGTEAAQNTGTAERVLEHIDGAHTRAASKKVARKAQAEAESRARTSRLQFTEEERATPELERYIKKSDKAADRLDEARAKIPKEKKLVKERTFDEAAGKGKTRLRFEEREKPMNGGKAHKNPLSRPAQEAGIFVHNKVHSVEKDNSGVEGAHKSEELAEKGAKYGARKIKEGYRSHKLKPYRAAAKAEKAAEKANANYLYQKALHDNPQIAASNPLSRYMQKQLVMSFNTNMGVVQGHFEFAGFDNYIETLKSKEMRSVIGNTLLYAAATILVELGIGLLVSAALRKNVKGSGIAKVCIILPMMMASIASGTIWRWMFTDRYGVINYFLNFLHIDGPMWLSEKMAAKFAVLTVSVWTAAPFVILVLLASISSVSDDIIEAAKIDGANQFQAYWYIIFPHLRSAIAVILLIRIPDALKMYDIVYILTGGGPSNSTQVISYYVYNQGFKQMKFAEASAASFLLFLVIAAFTILLNQITKRRKGGA